MNKETIQALIFSEAEENDIARKLLEYFTNNPDLLDIHYVLNRNIFHLLVKQNKAQVLKLLFEYSVAERSFWLDKAALPDRNGCTILHYAARNAEHARETMEVVLQYLPTLINSKNKYGQTSLHEAVSAQRVWAVKRLVSFKDCDRSIKNSLLKTAIEMPEVTDEIRQAYLSLDLSAIKLLDLRHRENSPGSRDSFRDSFPMLSSGNTPSPSRGLEYQYSLLRYQGSSSPTSSSSELSGEQEMQMDENQIIANEVVVSKLKQLLKIYITNKHSVICAPLLKEFSALFREHLLADDFDLSKEEAFQNHETGQILNDVLSSLYPCVNEAYAQNQSEYFILIDSFIHLLVPQISIADSKRRIAPKFNSDDEQQNMVRDTLWLLTACQLSHKSRRVFNFEVITNRALGVLSFISLLDVLVNLKALYPYFDRDQKLVANFIVLQLLYYNAINQVIPPSKLDFRLQFICKLNTNKENGLGIMGKAINRHLLKMQSLSLVSTKNILLHNFYILNRQASHPELVKSYRSFEQIVDLALTKSRDTRVDEVQIMAHELRILTFSLYQNVLIGEFWNNGWTKADRSKLSPRIVEFTDYFNKLSNYFVAKILSQPTCNIKNALQLFIEIAQALCPLADELYPDINHLMVIGFGVLANTNITRLTSFLKDLPSKDRRYLEEISKIVSPEKNYKIMRELYREFRTTLPFLGLLCRDMTFANDGNEEKIIKAEACGEILKKVLEVKLLVNFELTNFQTNLPTLLKEYTPTVDERLYSASRRLQPIKNDVIHWENTTEKMRINTDNIIINYILIDLLPTLIVNKKPCPPNQILSTLVDSLGTRIKKIKKEVEKPSAKSKETPVQQLLQLLGIIEKLKETIPDIVRINNMYYELGISPEMKKPELFLAKLDELIQLTELTGVLSQPGGKKETPHPGSSMRRRGSIHLLEKYGIYREKESSVTISSNSSASSCVRSSTPSPQFE